MLLLPCHTPVNNTDSSLKESAASKALADRRKHIDLPWV